MAALDTHTRSRVATAASAPTTVVATAADAIVAAVVARCIGRKLVCSSRLSLTSAGRCVVRMRTVGFRVRCVPAVVAAAVGVDDTGFSDWTDWTRARCGIPVERERARASPLARCVRRGAYIALKKNNRRAGHLLCGYCVLFARVCVCIGRCCRTSDTIRGASALNYVTRTHMHTLGLARTPHLVARNRT